eukprot:CAMPEP_0171655112 /NCGR_PEP_ID=MMETSP0990-20121206/40657_1 /TAXON_ID=483369 /ORGANISM="non described non described, Strain CCMP2098" /LENGTH=52 /DNA_ID=CAMNT_0012235063 /DNA_START=112 /DNA_END=266 /DNA_ORIENTATION=+
MTCNVHLAVVYVSRDHRTLVHDGAPVPRRIFGLDNELASHAVADVDGARVGA